MYENYQIKYLNLPITVKGFTLYDGADDYYTIVLNCKYSYDSMRQTFLHEIKHIARDDFHSNKSTAEIERELQCLR